MKKVSIRELVDMKKAFSGEDHGFKKVRDDWVVTCGSHRIYGVKIWGKHIKALTVDVYDPLYTAVFDKAAPVFIETPQKKVEKEPQEEEGKPRKKEEEKPQEGKGRGTSKLGGLDESWRTKKVDS